MTSHLDWSAYESGTDPFGFFDGESGLSPKKDGFTAAIEACSGKQRCLTDQAEVMCPSYRVTQDEAHSPYARARAFRTLVNKDDKHDAGVTEAVSAALDLCVGCKACKRECPDGVDIALMASEARARIHAARGRVSLRDRVFAALPRLAPPLSRIRPFLKLFDRVTPLAYVLKRSTGLSPRRSLPVPSRRSFLSSRSQPPSDGQKGDVVLFVDTFSNHFDPHIAAAAHRVLTRLGYRVHLPRPDAQGRALCCGRTYLSRGLIDRAREEAARTLAALEPWARAEIPIIGLEPSCLLMLRDEFRAMNPGQAAGMVAKHAVTFEEFMAGIMRAESASVQLPPMPGQRILIHGHCHQKAFGTLASVESILGAIIGAEVSTVASSCCGMAGAFGYEAEHYEVSMAMAEADLLPAIREAGRDTIIVANGTSCRQQILDGCGVQSIHLAQFLADHLIVGADEDASTTCLATRSPMASDAVSPGDSIPSR